MKKPVALEQIEVKKSVTAQADLDLGYESIDDLSDVTIEEYNTVVTKNYNKYHEQSEQLKALQDWIKKQKALFDKYVKEKL